MANNFSTADFLKGAYYSPIQVGKHEVTLGKPKINIEETESGKDASYLLLPMTFSNGRTVEQRFYNLGAKIACDQLRAQLEDATDYPALTDFLKTLENKTVEVYVSKRTYTDDEDKVKSTLQYDFVKAVEADETEEVAGPF